MTKRRRKPIVEYDIDIIIPVYGQFDLLKKTLDALPSAAAGLKWRLIIVDDFSVDTKEAKRFYLSNIAPMGAMATVLYNTSNMGYPYSVNRGVKAGRSDVVLLLNSDVVLGPLAINAMMDTLRGDVEIQSSPVDPAENKGVGVVAPQLVFADGGHRIQHAGIFFDLWATPIHRFIGWKSDNPLVNRPIGLQAVSGACLMTKREVWNAVSAEQRATGDKSIGAMNHVYGRGTYEDMEYCIAARANGYRVIYQPAATGAHEVGASAKETGGYPLARNKQIFMARCGHLLVYDEWMVT